MFIWQDPIKETTHANFPLTKVLYEELLVKCHQLS